MAEVSQSGLIVEIAGAKQVTATCHVVFRHGSYRVPIEPKAGILAVYLIKLNREGVPAGLRLGGSK